MLPTHCATRYVQPLREGGSLPAVVDTDDGGLFVVKFRGAGQGAKVLIAELIVGGIGAALGLPVPELALVEISDRFGRTEPDPEIQEILRRSHGTNVGLRYLDGAFNFDPLAAGDLVDPTVAAQVVWLDAFVTNPDRTARNPNLMVWERRPWLIDHGAALYAQHDWTSVDEARTRTPFPMIERHVLLDRASSIHEADRALAGRLDDARLRAVVDAVPDTLFDDATGPVGLGDFADAAAARDRYASYLTARFAERQPFVDAAEAARDRGMVTPPQRLRARR